MKLLLDTHIWIWSVLEPQRLSARVAKELSNGNNDLWLCSISIWEALMLHRKRRITLNADFGLWVRRSLKGIPVQEASITSEVALAAATVKLPHGDPADHLLVATAKVFGLTLVTSDAMLLKEGGIPTLSNKSSVSSS